MFDLWRLQREQQRVARRYAKDRRKLKKHGAATRTAVAELDESEYVDGVYLGEEIGFLHTSQLLAEAERFDIDTPNRGQDEYWEDSATDIGTKFLRPKGRAYIRKLIDEEKQRRFEVWTKWIKLFTPIAVAILTAVVSIVAILHHGK